jgi:ABC-2 type transport system permease protein
MNRTVLSAIFKRDFVSYFSNPTGYVFICVFVMLTSLAAFWPPEFFGNNLANLDQLSRWMPFILLVFVPAITMSVWAEEKRQGTDELLLTLPAADIDVVVGKYLAAVAIFTVSLLFSALAIFLVFAYGLGSPDGGLFLGSYLGYWFVGLAMLSIGMVASFLTKNLTVSFILGMIFNAPLAIFGVADWIVKDPGTAQAIRRWSALEQFGDFERGVVSLGGMTYFLSIVGVMLYISMVLIGRRHWSGGDDGPSKGGHYLVRALGLLLAAGGINAALGNHDPLRFDLTTEKLNSLAPSTVQLIQKLGANKDVQPIKVDVYVSPDAPAEYASQKRDLLSTLEELRGISGGKIQVVRHEIETFSEEATLAERTFGIESRTVDTKERGARTSKELYMGLAFTSGLDKVVVPFLDKGMPVEYELLRSIETVAQQKRKTVGLLKTDVQLNGGFTMQGPTDETQLIQELKKQYDVEEVDATKPITKKYDVLLAVQPSGLSPEAMDNFVAAVRTGQPTAIFEDPFPLPNFWQGVVGTAQPKQPGGGGMMGMFGGGGPPEPKGDITQLWNLLGVEVPGDQIIWQDYNPYPNAGTFVDNQWIFVDEGNGSPEPFKANNPIVGGLREVLFLLAGGVQADGKSKLEFTPLALTGTQTGTVSYADVQQMGQRGAFRRQLPTRESYVLAAQIKGKPSSQEQLNLKELTADPGKAGPEEPAAKPQAAETAADPAAAPADAELNVVVVADIDCLADPFFQIRQMGEEEDALVNWNFQNVVFVLNTLDELAGDERFLEVRKRTRQHRNLVKIDEATEEARDAALKERTKFVDDATQQIEAAQEEFRKQIAEIENSNMPAMQKDFALQQAQTRGERMLSVKIAELEKERDRKIRQTERDLAATERGVQDRYKFLAVLLPPIAPLLVAFFVFFRRRKSETEGVAKSRLRYGAKDAA